MRQTNSFTATAARRSSLTQRNGNFDTRVERAA